MHVAYTKYAHPVSPRTFYHLLLLGVPTATVYTQRATQGLSLMSTPHLNINASFGRQAARNTGTNTHVSCVTACTYEGGARNVQGRGRCVASVAEYLSGRGRGWQHGGAERPGRRQGGWARTGLLLSKTPQPATRSVGMSAADGMLCVSALSRPGDDGLGKVCKCLCDPHRRRRGIRPRCTQTRDGTRFRSGMGGAGRCQRCTRRRPASSHQETGPCRIARSQQQHRCCRN